MQITDLSKEEKITPLFRLGFRPFFLFGAIFSFITLFLWLFILKGTISFSPLGGGYWWHMHEMVYGFAAAIIAGFLLTAVQNWTGQRGAQGSVLIFLFVLWLAGRIVVLFPELVGNKLTVLIDLSFLPAVAYVLGKPIIAIKQYRNLFFVPLLALFTLANLEMHLAVNHPIEVSANNRLTAGNPLQWRPAKYNNSGRAVSEIILINVTGRDKPGLTSSITSIMADYGLEILDIGQSVIHDTLTWGIMVRLPDGNDSAPVLKDLLFHFHERHLQFSYQPISAEDYEAWVAEQGKNRYILTLLSRNVTAGQIARVSSITAEHGLNIDDISRLSGRRSLSNMSGAGNETSCLEFSVRGTSPDLEKLRADFLHISSELDVDVGFQEDNVYRRNRRLVVFDMDSTLIEAEVIDLLAEAAGVGEKVAEITERAMRGELDFNDSFRERLAMLNGLDETVLAGIAQKLPMTEGAERLIKNLRALGYRTAILSGGFTYFARHLQEKLGIDHVHANELEIIDGKVTGNVVGEIVNGQRKATLLKEIAAGEGVNLEQVIAVGDGANDLPMLSVAGLGIAFRAKPLVKKSARQSISTLGLDSILYLLGFSEKDLLSLNIKQAASQPPGER